MSVFTSWLGILAYTMQLYFDFSGYSDMAIGLGRLLGFEFKKNFDYESICDIIYQIMTHEKRCVNIK